MRSRDAWRARRGSSGVLAACVALGLSAEAARVVAQDVEADRVARQVAATVCDRRIVLLGELPSHGEARAFAVKARIVERLVGECGFDTVLFEAPIYDFLGLEQALATGDATPSRLDRAIGGFWATRGLSDWRRWLFEQAAADRLFVGGLDDQVSATSDHARAVLPDLVAGAVPAVDAAACREAVDRNLQWLYDDRHPFDEAERTRLERCGRLAFEGIGEDPDVAGARALIRNLATLYERQRTGVPDRDRVMYRNLRWLAARRGGDGKLIIWTATVHAARRQGDLRHRPLGAWLADEWGESVASIGFTAFAGASSMAGGPVREIPEAPAGSLEAIATEVGTSVFLPAESLRTLGVLSSRLLGRWGSADWSTLFDGVVVIREEVAPVFGNGSGAPGPGIRAPDRRTNLRDEGPSVT